jgi:hypothetical protein
MCVSASAGYNLHHVMVWDHFKDCMEQWFRYLAKVSKVVSIVLPISCGTELAKKSILEHAGS